MKPLSKLFASLLALGMIGSASAQTVITLTGSTAFRGETHDAILNVLSGEVYAYTGSNLTTASQAIFTGTLSGTSVIIKTSWSGSISGIVSVRNSANVNCLPNSTPQSAGGTANATTGTEARVPDLAFSDVSFTSTPFSSASLQEREVGIIPFQYVASFSARANLTNITSQNARQLWNDGFLPLAMATGSPDDRTTTITSTWGTDNYGGPIPRMLFALGRNAGSGTRFVYLAEPGIGVNSAIQQWDPRSFISGNNLTNHVLWPQETVDGILYPEGNSGYSSGGQLISVMRLNTEAGIGGAYISFLGVNDAAAITAPTGSGAGPGKTLTYNGVAYSPDAVKEGQYTAWSFQQLINRAPLGGTLQTFVNAMVPAIKAADPIYNGLQVSRSSDGATVFPLYP